MENDTILYTVSLTAGLDVNGTYGDAVLGNFTDLELALNTGLNVNEEPLPYNGNINVWLEKFILNKYYAFGDKTEDFTKEELEFLNDEVLSEVSPRLINVKVIENPNG